MNRAHTTAASRPEKTGARAEGCPVPPLGTACRTCDGGLCRRASGDGGTP